MKYKLSWDNFKAECPIISKIPILNLIAYKIMAEGYNNQKMQNEFMKKLLIK